MRRSKYTKELLEPIVKNNVSFAGVIKELGLKLTGGNYRHIQHRIRFNNIDTSHFKGQGWSKGETEKTNDSVKRQTNSRRYSDDEVFVENSPVLSGTRLTKRLLRLGWDYVCRECFLVEWRGKLLTLHLDHINGITNDNRFENLRILCPNCHQQTETWGNKKCVS